jgi:hypothetical protein
MGADGYGKDATVRSFGQAADGRDDFEGGSRMQKITHRNTRNGWTGWLKFCQGLPRMPTSLARPLPL